MHSSMTWLAVVIRVTIAPVLVGALALLFHTPRGANAVIAGIGLLLLATIHVLYWWDPWRRGPRLAAAALGGMLAINFVLLNLLGLSESLLWLYPAVVAGAGLRTPLAVLAIGFTALAAAAPLALEGNLVHPVDPVHATEALGPSHSLLLSIVLAGLAMNAVRQLIAANDDLVATRAELADVAVAADRERLGRELHDLLARTLSLIAVKAELASRLSARRDAGAAAELAEVQQLARQAVRDVRDAVTGSVSPNLASELVAARVALGAAGIELRVERDAAEVDPAHDSTLAWAVREAVTNVVRHSGALECRITLCAEDGLATLTIEDDGRGLANERPGTGLNGLADRVRALGGSLDIGPAATGGDVSEQAHPAGRGAEMREWGGRGFRVTVRLGAIASRPGALAG